MKIHEIIRDRIFELGLVRASVADQIGMDRGQFYHCLNGRVNFTVEQIEQLSKVLDKQFIIASEKIPEQIEKRGVKQCLIDEDTYKIINQKDFKVMFQMYEIMQFPEGHRKGMGELIAKQLRLIADAVRYCVVSEKQKGEDENDIKHLPAHSITAGGSKKTKTRG